MLAINGKLKTLESLSTTRWACSLEADVSAIEEQYSGVVSIEQITENVLDAKIRSNGNGLLYQVKSFYFVMCLEIMHPILQLIVKTSKALQSETMNLIEAVDEVETLASALKSFRNGAKFLRMFNKTIEKCEKLDINIQ